MKLGALIVLCLWMNLAQGDLIAKSTPLHRLFSDLFINYSTLVRPVENCSEATRVTVNLNLLTIEELDETKQELVTTGWFHLVWKDKFLVWDKDKYGGVSEIQVPPEKIWLPDLMVLNAMDKYGQLGGLDLLATVSHDGIVNWYVGDRRRTSCKVKVTRFPLDSQECRVKVVQWTTKITEVDYRAAEDAMTFYSFEENGEWNISGYKVFETLGLNNQYKRIHFVYIIDRRRAYYVISAILPVTILSLLNLFVFRVPPESGEKLTLCVSVLLSFAVYLTSINESLPQVSDHIAIFSIYLNIMFFLKALSVMSTVCVLYLFHTPLADGCIRSFLFCILRVDDHASNNGINTESLSLNSNDLCAGKVDRMYNDITLTSVDHHDNEWKRLIKRLDLVLFYIFLAFFLFSTIGMFTVISVM